MIAHIVVFVCAVILTADASAKCPTACVYPLPSGFCCFDGEYYPVRTRWPNKPGAAECAQYTCLSNGQVGAVGCPLMQPSPDPLVVCYNITVPEESYPHCCTKIICPELM